MAARMAVLMAVLMAARMAARMVGPILAHTRVGPDTLLDIAACGTAVGIPTASVRAGYGHRSAGSGTSPLVRERIGRTLPLKLLDR